MVNNEAIIAELGKHPYTPEDKITFGGASHYCKVFKLGSGKIEIVYKSGNAGAICEAMSTTECIDKNGIIVDGTDVYVLKETSPRGTFARYVVLETNTGMQLKGIVDASSVSLTKGQSIGAINGGANKSTLPITGDYEGQLATCEDGSTYVWDGTAWIRQNNECGNNYIATIDQFFSVYEIGTHDSKQGSRLMQVGFDFKISFNTCCTFNGNVKLIGVYDSSYGLSTRSKFMVWTAPSSLCLGKDYPLDANDVTTPFDISKFATFNIRSKIVNNDVHKVYLEIAVNRSALATSIRNRMNPVFTFSNFDYDKDFVPTLNNTLLETGTSDSEFNTKYGYKKCSTEYFTGVPISTSADQMLVSNGNGGWEVQNGTQDIYRTWSFFVTSPSSSNVINMKWCGLWKKTKSAKKMPVSIPFKLTIDSTNEYHGTIYFTFVNANGFVNPIIVWEDITPSAKAKAVFEKMQVVMREGSDDTLHCEFWTSSASTASTHWYTISYEMSGRFINSDRGGFSSADNQQINHRLENNQIRDAMGASFLYERKCNGATPTIEATITHYMKSQTAI